MANMAIGKKDKKADADMKPAEKKHGPKALQIAGAIADKMSKGPKKKAMKKFIKEEKSEEGEQD
jgi:ABC-type glycerol-3-phosphate transport system substrate-binding protein